MIDVNNIPVIHDSPDSRGEITFRASLVVQNRVSKQLLDDDGVPAVDLAEHSVRHQVWELLYSDIFESLERICSKLECASSDGLSEESVFVKAMDAMDILAANTNQSDLRYYLLALAEKLAPPVTVSIAFPHPGKDA